MLWILVTVLVGLFVIIVQLLLSYQRRAARLRVAQNPLRKQIKDCQDKITEVGEGVRSLANESLAGLKKDLGEFQRRSGLAANLNAELDSEAQAWVAAREGEGKVDEMMAEPEDPLFDTGEESAAGTDQDDEIDAILGGRKDANHHVDSDRANPVELVRGVRHELEETFEYIESLRTDAGLIQQSLQLLGQDKDKGDGANGSA